MRGFLSVLRDVYRRVRGHSPAPQSQPFQGFPATKELLRCLMHSGMDEGHCRCLVCLNSELKQLLKAKIIQEWIP